MAHLGSDCWPIALTANVELLMGSCASISIERRVRGHSLQGLLKCRDRRKQRGLPACHMLWVCHCAVQRACCF